jgi:hypothetical protein
MRNFVFDENPKCCGTHVTMIDPKGKEVNYRLQRVKGNGCVLSVEENEIVRDEVAFTMQDLKALYLLLTVSDEKCRCDKKG